MRKASLKNKKNTGSILVGVVLVFLMISSIAIAVIGRSKQGAELAIDSKKGYSAYQDSDQDVEKILNEIKSLDKDTSGKIPENTDVSQVCGGTCYAVDKTVLAPTDKVAKVFSVKKIGEAQGTKRAVLVPVLDRVENPVSNLAVVGDFPNCCDAKLTWDSQGGLESKISNLEVRKNLTSSSLASDGWIPLSPNNPTITYGSLNKSVINSEFNYGQKYYFSLKAKNKNPLALDSLYYASPVTFTAPPQNCSGGQRVGCYSAQLPNSTKSSALYACCGGTECFECNPEWEATVASSCCTQTCPAPTPCPSGPCGGGAHIDCVKNNCQSYTPESCTPPIGYSSCDTDEHGHVTCSC